MPLLKRECEGQVHGDDCTLSLIHDMCRGFVFDRNILQIHVCVLSQNTTGWKCPHNEQSC